MKMKKRNGLLGSGIIALIGFIIIAVIFLKSLIDT